MNETINKLKSFGWQCTRVWHLLRKPTTEELKKTAIISALGLGIIGLMGFIITIAMNFFFPK